MRTKTAFFEKASILAATVFSQKLITFLYTSKVIRKSEAAFKLIK